MPSFNKDLLDSLSKEEREVAIKILNEMASGKSSTFDKIRYADYEEIPVSISVFLHNKRYLGNGLINEEGKFTVFKYWEDTLNKIFPDPLQPASCNTLALTGGIGLGKSFVAVICMLYELYRMLCLKDPYLYYGLQPIDLITFSVMNITLDAAKGVAWSKLQQLLLSSEWFMEKGTLSKGDNPQWKPPKGIELIYGSLPRHIIGRAVFSCLDGDTQVLTTSGLSKIRDLVYQDIAVYTVDDNGQITLSDTCTVKQTDFSSEEYQIELEDGTVIKCTPTHRFLLKNGEYKEARYLTEEDELADFNQDDLKDTVDYNQYINGILVSRGRFISEDIYKERHHIIPICKGGTDAEDNLIDLYPQEHYMAHKLLYLQNPKDRQLFYAWHMLAFSKGKTKRDTIISASDYAILRKVHSQNMKDNNNFLDREGHPWNFGKSGIYTPETLQKMSNSRKGKGTGKKSEETRRRMKLASQNRDWSNFKGYNKGKMVISSYDGSKMMYIDNDQELPDGFYFGNCKTSCRHNMQNYYSDSQAILNNRLSKSGNKNSMYGNGYRVSGDKNGHAIHDYFYGDMKFTTKNDLFNYLNYDLGIKITKSTITKICENKLSDRCKSKYEDIYTNIRRELKK